jgi:hypothetical protein
VVTPAHDRGGQVQVHATPFHTRYMHLVQGLMRDVSADTLTDRKTGAYCRRQIGAFATNQRRGSERWRTSRSALRCTLRKVLNFVET